MGIRSGIPEFETIGHSDQNQYLDLSGAGISFQLQNLASNEEMFYGLENWKETSGWEQSATSRELKTHLEQGTTKDNYHSGKTLSGPTMKERIACTKGCNISWGTEGDFSISGNSEKSEVKVNLSGLKNRTAYALSFSITNSEKSAVEIYLRQNGPTYRKLSASKVLIPERSVRDFYLVFDRPDAQAVPALMLTFYQGNETTRITEFLISSVDPVQKLPEQKNYKLLTNPQNSAEVMAVEADWQDLSGKSHTNQLTLAPFQSLFLIRK